MKTSGIYVEHMLNIHGIAAENDIYRQICRGDPRVACGFFIAKIHRRQADDPRIKDPGGRLRIAPERTLSYFFRKDRQSVHWSWVGLHSWVPTMIRSREQ